jgi:hypothetical protein
MHPRHVAVIALASFLAREACGAQKQPAMVPTVVAQAMTSYVGGMFGPPRYSVRTAPVGWPKELIPANARVLGGGTLGSAESFRILTLVVNMPAAPKPSTAIQAMAASAGYGSRLAAAQSSQGGFIESAGVPQDHMPLCKGTTSMFAFSVVDSVASPRIFSLTYIDGAAAKQNCDAAERSRIARQGGPPTFGPKHMPALVAPTGIAARASGMSWSGSSGSMETVMRTTMTADSILAHYAGQLVAAGWKLDGSVLANRGMGVQKFRFMDDDEPWSALMIIESNDNRRHLTLRLTMVNAEP